MVYFNNQDKITFPMLVMEQIKIIQKLLSEELRDGELILKNALGEQVIQRGDTRYAFLQSVECLGSMLSPYFGTMEINFDEFCDYYNLELVEAIENKKFKELLSKIFSDDEIKKIKNNVSLQSQANLILLNDKVKFGRKIFRDLIKIFKENSFLGEESFGEGASETAPLEMIDDSEEDILK